MFAVAMLTLHQYQAATCVPIASKQPSNRNNDTSGPSFSKQKHDSAAHIVIEEALFYK